MPPAEWPGFSRAVFGSVLLHLLAALLLMAGGEHPVPPGRLVVEVVLRPPPARSVPARAEPSPAPRPPAPSPRQRQSDTPPAPRAPVPSPTAATTATEPRALPAEPATSSASEAFPPPEPLPSPALAPPPASAAEFDQLRATYLATVRGAVEARKTYPPLARRSRQQGTVLVRFRLDCDGRLLELALAASSGRPLLDRAALQAVEAVGRFPAFPVQLGRGELSFEVPIAFRLAPP